MTEATVAQSSSAQCHVLAFSLAAQNSFELALSGWLASQLNTDPTTPDVELQVPGEAWLCGKLL